MPSISAVGTKLETEARLQFDDPSGQESSWLTESDVVDASAVALRLERSKVPDVENIEKVKANVQVRSFAQHSQVWQTESFGDAHVHIKVFWPAENIASHAGRVRRKIFAR